MSNKPRPVFSTTCRVLYGDTDAAGVVYNANYLRYFEQGRTEMMREWVCTYKEIESQGLILPVTECHVRFKSPAFYDDLLNISTSVAELTQFTCRFNYRITRQETDGSKPILVARGYTVHAAVTRAGKLIRLPQCLLDKLAPIVSR